MAEFPIIPGKTAMLYFDTLNAYLHPDDPARQALDRPLLPLSLSQGL